MPQKALVMSFIGSCLKKGTAPWKYFQLNAPYFNEEKGIFSKLEIDEVIPGQWRLKTVSLSEHPGEQVSLLEAEFAYPFFLKPEWGQNSYGVYRVCDRYELQRILEVIAQSGLPYFAQEAAQGQREFELFYIRDRKRPDHAAVFSLSESLDPGSKGFLPVHGVKEGTCYRDLTASLESSARDVLTQHCLSMGEFQIARVGVKAGDLQELVRGHFKIFEINIYTPMPLSLFDETCAPEFHQQLLKACGEALAELITQLPERPKKKIFWKKAWMNRKIKKLRPVLNPSTAC